MSEKEKKDVQAIADIYKDLTPFQKGVLVGYAEAIKEQRADQPPEDPNKDIPERESA